MTGADVRRIFVLALALSPDEFEDKVFFNAPDLCPDSSNAFYNVGQVRRQLMVVQSIVIAGQSRRVTKIMAYKQIWMRTYYYEPMQRLNNRFVEERQAEQLRAMSEACTIS
ncbi:unnamed protein product [Rotaria sp. Silwood1]|nr:unnamed protein product [Rotaria sp. Silwood1]CAF1626756.1 unnamed protein product [Rotaria sp. Silwood1]CAF3986133.1 unnamed protein product [Rotaria sp. Silwood1]CAF3991544.1 unnamed protein product [Rotaria sp. Silwood1]CAF5070193.1 unnamed protein product [Rotaria sp. Silwood1]